MITIGKLQKKRNPIPGIFINPGGSKAMAKRPRRKKAKMQVYVRSNPDPAPKKRRRRRSKKIKSMTFKYNSPRKAARRRYKRNPPPQQRRRRAGGEGGGGYGVGTFLSNAAFALLGWLVPGLVWKAIGARMRASVAGWFGVGAVNAYAKGQATITALTTGLMYWLTGTSLLRPNRRYIMSGTGMRLFYDGANALIPTTPGSGSETLRMIVGLPTAQSVGAQYVGQTWPQNLPPPAGTKIDPATGKLVLASYEEGEYPYADQYGQVDQYGQPVLPGQQYNQPALPPAQPGSVNAGFDAWQQNQAAAGAAGAAGAAAWGGAPWDAGPLMGYAYRQFNSPQAALQGYAYRQYNSPQAALAGYAMRRKNIWVQR